MSGPDIEIPFSVMTEAGFPHGLRCPECDRRIEPGQPYAKRLEGIDDDGSTVSFLTCVYCLAVES